MSGYGDKSPFSETPSPETQGHDASSPDRQLPTRLVGKRVALFVTCLADLMRPSVARASLQLLEDAGCDVHVPQDQTCCGQPAYNSGDYPGAMGIAQQTIETFEPFDFVVAPSGSCAGMLKCHYPKLLAGEWRERAQALGERVFELTQFLQDVCVYTPTPSVKPAALTYHDSCAGLRELGVREQPRALLRNAGIEPRELDQRDVCCGFGGTFCAKMPAISAKMADDKLLEFSKTDNDLLVAGDLGCLLALAGRARRLGSDVEFRHVAEVLAGTADVPGIAHAESGQD